MAIIKLPRRQTQPGETSTDRMRAASSKAREAFLAVARRARSLNDELDEATSPAIGSGVVSAELDEEDSAVIVVHEMIQSLAAKSG